MRSAPEMSPTLDDALRAADYPLATHDAQRLRPVLAFLNQLDDVRDVPALVLNQAEAEHMEGAYLAGVRCADESGHVLVMSLPAFLQLCPPPVPRASLRARVRRWFATLAAPCPPDCDECRPARLMPPPPASGCSYPECFCSFEKMVAGCKTRPTK